MNPRLNTLDDLVKPEKGLIGRRIFVDQEIFEAEHARDLRQAPGSSWAMRAWYPNPR
jgi:hypothetical protein